MAAETLTATRAASTFPVFKPSGAGALGVAYGSYDIAANVEAGDIFEMCRLPAGAVVLGGFFRVEDIDTHATATVDMDVGWAANGAEAVDTDGFGNFGVINGTAVTNYKPETGAILPLSGVLKDGFVTFTRETVVQVYVNAACATFSAGTISVVVFYVVP